MIFAIFNKFASGLSLYYLCFNVLTAFQQKFINKSLEAKKEAQEADGKADTSRKPGKVSSNGKSSASKKGGKKVTR
jgi:YidC/Oxa1 family membrane protein insertase